MFNILQRACIRPLILVLSLTCIKPGAATAQPGATPATYPSTAASVSHSTSEFSFANPQRACASDDNFASAQASFANPSGTTAYLITSGHSFSLPLTATITGIEVRIERRASGLADLLGVPVSYVTDHTVRLVINGSLAGQNKASSTHWGSAKTTRTYGGPGDTWGITWLPQDIQHINAGNFGVAFAAELSGVLAWYPAAHVDGINITIHYIEPVLPLKLLRFTATLKADNTVQAQWQTTGDKDATFVLERSQDGATWEAVPGAQQHATQGGIEWYTQTDAQPLPGISYYRLAMREASGVQSWSAVRTVKTGMPASINVYPNPATSYIILSGIAPGSQPVITNANGRMISLPVLQYGPNSVRIDIRNLPPGMYFLKAGNEVKRFVKTGG